MQFSRRTAAVQHSSDATSPSWLHVPFHHGHNLRFIPAPSAAATLHSGHVDTSPPLAIKPNRFAFRLHDGPRLRAVQPGVHFRPSGSGIGAGVPMPLLPSCSVSWCVCLPPSPPTARCNLVHLRAELLCCITMVAALSRCHPPSLTPPPDQPSRHMQDKPRSCRRHGSWRSCAADPMADDQPRRRALTLPAAEHHPLFSLPRTRNHRHQRGHFP